MLFGREAETTRILLVPLAALIALLVVIIGLNNLPPLALYRSPSEARSLQVYCFVSGGLLPGAHPCPNAQSLYLRALVDSTPSATDIEWTYHSVDVEEFLRKGAISQAPAGSIIVAHSERNFLAAGGTGWGV